MAIEVRWYVADRVVLARGKGIVTKAENAESDRLVAEYIQKGVPPVHVIIDVTDVEDFPFFNANYEADNVQQFLKSDNLGWGILCGTVNPVVRFMASIVLRVTKVRFKMFSTLEEGLQFLREQDQTIPWELVEK